METATTTPHSPEEDTSIVTDILERAKHRYAWMMIATAGCALAAVTGAYILGFVVADHMIGSGVPPGVRIASLVLYAAAATGIAAVGVARPIVRRISDVYAARLLERRHPAFRNSLINAVQLSEHREIPGSIRAAVLASAANDAVRADVRHAIGQAARSRLREAGVGLTAVGLLFAAYACVAPKPLWPSIKRAFGSPVPAPTRTTILAVEPADGDSVPVGRPVTFAVRLGGQIPAEAFVQFSADGGISTLAGQRLALAPAGTAESAKRGQIWQATRAGEDVRESVLWKVTAGDASTPWRQLVVRPMADVVELRITCNFPPYTGLAPTTAPADNPGDVDAVIGTRVTVEATTNVPVRDPVLVMTGDGGEESETRLLMRNADLDSTRIVGEFTVVRNEQYLLRFFDRFGEPNRDPIKHNVRARPDRPPTVVSRVSDSRQRGEREAAASRPASALVPPDGKLPMDDIVEDDYGLTRLEIEFTRGSQRGTILLPSPAKTPRAIDARTLPPVSVREFGGGPGDEIEWRLAAWDNRVAIDGRLAPQKGLGAVQRFVIGTPGGALPSAKGNEGAASQPSDEETSETATSQPSLAEADGTATSQPSLAESDGTTTRQEASELDGKQLARDESDAIDRFVQEHKNELAKLEKLLKETESKTADADKADDEFAGGANTQDGDKSQNADAKARDDNHTEDANRASKAAEESHANARAGQKPNAERKRAGQEPNLERPRAGPTEPRAQASGPNPNPERQRAGQADAGDDAAGKGDANAKAEAEGAGEGSGEGKEPRNSEGQPQAAEQSEQQVNGDAQRQAEDEKQGQGEGQGGSQGEGRGQENGQGRGQGDGQGEGEGEDQGEGQGQEQGKGKEHGQGVGSGEGEGEGAGGGKGSGAPRKGGETSGIAGANPSTIGGSGGSPGGASAGGDGAVALDLPRNQRLPHSPRKGLRLEATGSVFDVIDALEQRLRKKELDPALLDDLAWDEARAADFVREFRRAERQARDELSRTEVPDGRFETTIRPATEVERSEGAGTAARLRTQYVRPADRTNRLFETGSQRVPQEYRDLLEAYYRSLAADRPTASQPAQ